MLEVVAEDELVAGNVVLGREGEGYRVAVVRVLGGGEVGRGGGGAFGEACSVCVLEECVERGEGGRQTYRGSL